MKTLVLVYFGFVICGRMVRHILAVVEIEAKLVFLPRPSRNPWGLVLKHCVVGCLQ